MGRRRDAAGPEDPRRDGEALRQRYLGVAILGVAILAYWSFRIVSAWWSE